MTYHIGDDCVVGSLGHLDDYQGKLPSIPVTSRSRASKGISLDLVLEEIRCTHTLACIFIYLAFVIMHMCFIDLCIYVF
jgi:hypothetical protein